MTLENPMAPCMRHAAPASRPLIQIHSGYRSEWGDLLLCVETAAAGFAATVHDHGRVLYSAERCSLAAAKTAVAEFAQFRVAGGTGQETPEGLAGRLPWRACW